MVKKKINRSKSNMREKILELIHKELENVGGENIFHDCYNGVHYLTPNPIRPSRFRVKLNCDTDEYITPDLLDFALKFEDGEPSIRIYTMWDYKSTNKIYKTKYFGLQKFWETNAEYTFTTKITCGHISFDLSNEENDELVKLTKQSYEKYLSLKDKIKDKEVSKKIKKRLKKYEN